MRVNTWVKGMVKVGSGYDKGLVKVGSGYDKGLVKVQDWLRLGTG